MYSICSIFHVRTHFSLQQKYKSFFDLQAFFYFFFRKKHFFFKTDALLYKTPYLGNKKKMQALFSCQGSEINRGAACHFRRIANPPKMIETRHAAPLRAETRTRTGDLFITNELLYQLSHFGEK